MGLATHNWRAVDVYHAAASVATARLPYSLSLCGPVRDIPGRPCILGNSDTETERKIVC